MKTAVRYYSRSGNTKLLAEAFAQAAEAEAVSVDGEHAALGEGTDLLFIGGALYAYGIDKRLQDFIDSIEPGTVGKAVLFSTSWLSRHALELMRKSLTEKGVAVAHDEFYVRGRPNAQQLAEAQKFAKKYL